MSESTARGGLFFGSAATVVVGVFLVFGIGWAFILAGVLGAMLAFGLAYDAAARSNEKDGA